MSVREESVTTMETKPKDEKEQEPVVFEKVTVHGGAAGGQSAFGTLEFPRRVSVVLKKCRHHHASRRAYAKCRDRRWSALTSIVKAGEVR